VVRDFEERKYEPTNRIYLPADLTDLPLPVSFAVRVSTRPAIGFAPRIREIAAAVDPALQVTALVSVAERRRQGQQVSRYVAIGAAAAMLSVVLLSAAGIYAMMSFTVVRRRREIGIRSALGADARRVLGSIFARASVQLSAGMVLGLLGTVALDGLTGRGPVGDGNAIALVEVAALMTVVGLLAATVPARRGLAIQPTEALRDE
jgi:ABC-type antimicrobial peptide transport system permease subunit